ncbi:Catechol 2,3-dioxygenase [Flavobacteriaceae bacterium MAR_2010_188]|nr:Catechol 2,3-dioxygenase [Flavobacteriaceae bacterium MAR_2010_188]
MVIYKLDNLQNNVSMIEFTKKIKVLMLLMSIVAFGELGAQNDFHLYKDHDALPVKDLEKSAKFYSEVLGLKEISNAGLGERFRWFELNDHVQIHLILTDGIIERSKNLHLAINADNLDAFIKHLTTLNVHFENWSGDQKITNTRPDGVKQIYLQDPDGYWIEVNDNSFN